MGLKLFFLLLICGVFPFGKSIAQDLVEIKLIDSISVSFDSGSSLVRNPSKLINRLNQTTISRGKIQLISYTDTVGGNSYNKMLASKRLSSVLKLIGSTKIKDFVMDSLNQNEQRKGIALKDESFRRVDILIYSVEAKIKFDVPINLRINFHSGSDNIVMSSSKNLKMLQMLMEMDTSFQIKLNGHVCCQSNLDLSLKRAERVKTYLVDHGIDIKRIHCKGFSNDVKLVPETSEENKRKNMRVEVVFIK